MADNIVAGGNTIATREVANVHTQRIATTDLGETNDAAASSDTGTFSVIALIKRALQNWTTLLARIPALGQGLMAASVPVTIASNQTAISVNAASAAPAGPTGTIANGASLSGTITLTGEVVGILMPAAWTAASLTFRGSTDGTNFFDLYDDLGQEVTMPTAASRFLGVANNGPFRGLRSLQVRSGTAATPVNQGAARTITIVTVV